MFSGAPERNQMSRSAVSGEVEMAIVPTTGVDARAQEPRRAEGPTRVERVRLELIPVGDRERGRAVARHLDRAAEQVAGISTAASANWRRSEWRRSTAANSYKERP